MRVRENNADSDLLTMDCDRWMDSRLPVLGVFARASVVEASETDIAGERRVGSALFVVPEADETDPDRLVKTPKIFEKPFFFDETGDVRPDTLLVESVGAEDMLPPKLSLRWFGRGSVSSEPLNTSVAKSGMGPSVNASTSFLISSFRIRCRCSKTRLRNSVDSIATFTALSINVRKYEQNDGSALYMPPDGSGIGFVPDRRHEPTYRRRKETDREISPHPHFRASSCLLCSNARFRLWSVR